MMYWVPLAAVRPITQSLEGALPLVAPLPTLVRTLRHICNRHEINQMNQHQTLKNDNNTYLGFQKEVRSCKEGISEL
jgi:hypothetical protein